MSGWEIIEFQVGIKNSNIHWSDIWERNWESHLVIVNRVEDIIVLRVKKGDICWLVTCEYVRELSDW